MYYYLIIIPTTSSDSFDILILALDIILLISKCNVGLDVKLSNTNDNLLPRMSEYFNSISFEDELIATPEDTSSVSLVDDLISPKMVYNTYIARKAPEVVIDILRDYSIDDVLSNVS